MINLLRTWKAKRVLKKNSYCPVHLTKMPSSFCPECNHVKYEAEQARRTKVVQDALDYLSKSR